MRPRFAFGRENVPCFAEVVNRSLKADCTDFNKVFSLIQNQARKYMKHNKSYLQKTKWFVKNSTAILSVSNHGYVFSFNLTFKFDNYVFLLF